MADGTHHKPIRWGILATGKIAAAMTGEARFVENAVIEAVGSRSLDKAQAFADTHNIQRAHGSYSALAADPAVDLVYIATPHNSHFELIQLCLNAGKHVLCEKPMVLNARQARECAQLATEKKLFLMEALWTRFFPAIQQVHEWIKQGRIGAVRRISADFSFEADFDPKGRLFDPALAGGALLDLGIYPLALATDILGSPIEVKGQAIMGETGVDVEDKISLRFVGGATALLKCGLRENRPVVATIDGDRGRITLHERFHHPNKITLEPIGGDIETCEFSCAGRGYHYQITAVCEAVRLGKTQHERMPLSDTIRLVETMDQLRSSWGLSYPDE